MFFLQIFEGIECEWPLFYLYMSITGKPRPLICCHAFLISSAMFRGEKETAEVYWKKLMEVVIIPEYGEYTIYCIHL